MNTVFHISSDPVSGPAIREPVKVFKRPAKLTRLSDTWIRCNRGESWNSHRAIWPCFDREADLARERADRRRLVYTILWIGLFAALVHSALWFRA